VTALIPRPSRSRYAVTMDGYRPDGAVSDGDEPELRLDARPARGALARYVATLWALDAPRGGAIRTLPDGCVDLAVDFRDGHAWIVGVRPSARRFAHRPGARLIGASLAPGAAPALLGPAAAGTLGPERRRLAELLDPARVAALEAAVAAAAPGPAQLDTLEAWLAAAFAAPAPAASGRDDGLDPRVGRALDAISASRGLARVDALGRLAGASPRNLDRLFRRQVGIGPKRLLRIVRFQAALTQLRAGRALDFAALAAELGYADQSHLIRDFCAFSGITPSRLRARLR
jgi:AraC-like DNA-binding protein